MTSFRSILVDVDATAPAHPALDRAVQLARASGARLTIVDVMTVPRLARQHLPADLEESLVGRRRHALARMAQAITGVPVESRLLVGRPATVLVQEILRAGHDLVVRAHARDLAGAKARPFGAIDMELLRTCPCPVLLAGPRSASPPHIVAAVNASVDTESEAALNEAIVELTLQMAELEGGSATLLQAWAPFAEQTIRDHCAQDVFASYVEEVRQQAGRDLARLAAPFRERAPGLRVSARRGAPEEVIVAFVVAEGVDLVVMGTVARTGIAGLVIGNTAERVLRQLPCSVLAVKPAGFVSPVRLDA